MQKTKNLLKSLAAVYRKRIRNAADNSEKVVHPCSKLHHPIGPR